MKKFLFILVAILPIMLFTACDKAVSEGRTTYKAYFNHILKDPDSFKIYSEKYTKDGEYTVNWELDYGAKNSLGGMVREQISFETVGTTIHIDGNFYELKDLR
ncbi:hypothetical protein AAE250_20550 [Bacteroides sp. GD17]|jgi:hypothetical protein|uniref:hypothetical protein n=1 Tax=Bacteroides sp. GD17 TaxID=3139826 RepID=UPI0025FCC538|nr:hypothetical protein [uncultured Bacteroides sp.]